MRLRLPGALAAALLAPLLVACGVELEHGLDERQANQIAAVLDQHGIAGEKQRDEAADAWKITVPRGELSRAFQVLESYDLPRRGRRGLGETLAERGLLPSMAEEQARLEVARAVELERTLERIPGVVSARVHLALPEARLDGSGAPGRGAVLLRTDGTPSVTEEQVRLLVAGATPGLRAEAVQVISAGGLAPAAPRGTETVGPLSVARGERGRVVAIAASGLALLVALGAALVITALRLSQARSRESDQSPPSNLSG